MEMVIRWRDDNFPTVTRIDDGGGEITKLIKPDDLFKLMNMSLVTPRLEFLSSPILPENCLRYGEAPDGFKKVMIKVPEQNHYMWLRDERMEDVAFPSLIFVFALRETTVVGKFVAAVKEDYILGDTPLFRYPYSNVFNDGSCCWSGLPQITDIRQLGTLPELFFASPDTEHNYEKANSSGLVIRELLEKYRGKRFPKEFLVPLGLTVDQFWNQI